MAHSMASQDSSGARGRSLTLGFIGCGTIASSMITGFAEQTSIKIKSILISRRSESKSSSLAKNFSKLVIVEDDNQRIVDSADIIFLTVLPQQASEIVQKLHFNAESNILISLVSTSKISTLSNDSKLPSHNVYKMICLPVVAHQEGVCLLQPKPVHVENSRMSLATDLLEPLFESLGGVVIAENDEEMAAMMVPSALMGSFYGILRNNQRWLIERQNLAPEKATFLIGRMYYGMIKDAIRKSAAGDQTEAFDKLIAEQTPGGLNEQVLRNLLSLGVMTAFDEAQDAVVARIQGKTDGSLINKS